jgi:hypothetical protein
MSARITIGDGDDSKKGGREKNEDEQSKAERENTNEGKKGK